ALVLQSQNIEHRIQSRRLAVDPLRRLERAAREDHAVGRLVGQLDALVRAGKDHAVLARDIAAAQAGKADIASLPRTGVAVASARGSLREIDSAARGGRLTEQE